MSLPSVTPGIENQIKVKQMLSYPKTYGEWVQESKIATAYAEGKSWRWRVEEETVFSDEFVRCVEIPCSSNSLACVEFGEMVFKVALITRTDDIGSKAEHLRNTRNVVNMVT